MDRFQRNTFIVLAVAALIAAVATVAEAAEPASSASRCIFITEGDGTLVAVCGKAVR